MKIYRVERMTDDSYHNYMGGGYNYYIDEIEVVAETPRQAAVIAREGNRYHVNENNVVEVKEGE